LSNASRTKPRAPGTFEQFLVDVGFTGATSWMSDTIQTPGVLSFAGIEPLTLPAIPIAQHLAEKVHAYTRTYGESERAAVLLDPVLAGSAHGRWDSRRRKWGLPAK
jgi:hypothetical protein